MVYKQLLLLRCIGRCAVSGLPYPFCPPSSELITAIRGQHALALDDDEQTCPSTRHQPTLQQQQQQCRQNSSSSSSQCATVTSTISTTCVPSCPTVCPAPARVAQGPAGNLKVWAEKVPTLTDRTSTSRTMSQGKMAATPLTVRCCLPSLSSLVKRAAMGKLDSDLDPRPSVHSSCGNLCEQTKKPRHSERPT